MESRLARLDLTTMSRIAASYWRCPQPSNEWGSILIVRFEGTHANDHVDVPFMEAMIAAGMAAFGASADNTILDLRMLTYTYGDLMGGVLDAVPIAVVSDRCEAGLTSLLRDEMRQDPALHLFRSLDEAVKAVDCWEIRRGEMPRTWCEACGQIVPLTGRFAE